MRRFKHCNGVRKLKIKPHTRHLKGRSVKVKTHNRRAMGGQREATIKNHHRHRKDVERLAPPNKQYSNSIWRDHAIEGEGADG